MAYRLPHRQDHRPRDSLDRFSGGMVDPITTATIVVAHGFWRFFDAAGAYVTAISETRVQWTGKSTLDRQLMTEGKIRPFGEMSKSPPKEFLSKHHKMLSDTFTVFVLTAFRRPSFLATSEDTKSSLDVAGDMYDAASGRLL